jgi:antitoxin (DNA-binding transcriptional repressor) of toxin-antitoxin stability system
MGTYEIREDESELLRLVRMAADGAPLILTMNGEPLVEVVPIKSAPDSPVTRIGFMKGEIEAPDDFDRLFPDEIVKIFEGRD